MRLLQLAAVLAPLYLFGIWVGSRLFRGISESLFRRVVLALVFAMGTVALLV